MGSDWWSGALRRAFADRRVIVAGAVAAAWVDHVECLRAAGATEVLVVATGGRGAGSVPDVPTVVVEPPPGLEPMEQIHHDLRQLADPPDEVVAAVDEFDPDGAALVVGTFLNSASHLAGRRFLAHRWAEWVALEDKTVIDALFDRAGVARQPSEVVAVADAADASRRLDRGAGTVWAGDARSGFNGGASRTRHVVDSASATRAREQLAPYCDLVRVMPFVEGVPCSIHGIVLPDGIAVLRPVEMVVLRRGGDFVYAGCATYWDPPATIRVQLRDAARAVGRQLAREVGFRGTFTLDGVAAADGFWPTEVNPRFGGGIMTIARAAEGLPLLLLNDLIVAGRPIGIDAARLEAELVSFADEQRGGGTWMLAANGPNLDGELRVARTDGRWHRVGPNDGVAGRVAAGSGFARCTYAPEATPTGPPTAALAAAFWAFADAELGTDVGSVVASEDPFG